MTTGGTLTPGLRARLVELFGPDGALELMDRVPQAPWHELARKSDIGELRTEFGQLRAETKAEFVDLRTEMRRDFATKDELRWAVETSEHRLEAAITSNASSNLRCMVSTIMIGNATVIASVIAAFVALR